MAHCEKQLLNVKRYPTKLCIGKAQELNANPPVRQGHALRNAGLQSLAPGQPVRMKVVTARKGPEAVTVELNGPIGAPPA